jgi:hypothetical protein
MTYSIPAGWQNDTNKNDEYPSWITTNGEFKVFIAPADPLERYDESDKRFMVARFCDECGMCSCGCVPGDTFETDSWDAVLNYTSGKFDDKDFSN